MVTEVSQWSMKSVNLQECGGGGIVWSVQQKSFESTWKWSSVVSKKCKDDENMNFPKDGLIV